jgi:short-chain fatty acids transporter
MSFADKFASTYKKILPSPFTIAVLITITTFFIALIFTKPFKQTNGDYALELVDFWESGLWKPGAGGLYFAFQMMLMLVLGHVLALSMPISYLINKLTNYCTTTANTAALITATTILISLFNWGLGLIFGAVLARKVGEKFAASNQKLNYGLIGASAYSGLMVWHGGISGSAPIKAAETNNLKTLLADTENVNLELLPNTVPFESTVFSTMNIVVSLMLLIILPTLMYLLGKKNKSYSNLPSPLKENELIEEQKEGAEKLDSSRTFSIVLGLLFVLYSFYKAVILPDSFSFKFITPNYINFTLFGLAFLVHKNITQFLKATSEAISGAVGILIQFPLYFGILGIMVGSGLIVQISDNFVFISNEITFPILTFISAGLVNIFVPSGGAQWAVQGPIIISAAQELGVSYSKSIMALAYGDQLTNMLQPFWALPLLGITGLKAKDILPYTLILFVAGGCIFLTGLLLF